MRRPRAYDGRPTMPTPTAMTCAHLPLPLLLLLIVSIALPAAHRAHGMPHSPVPVPRAHPALDVGGRSSARGGRWLEASLVEWLGALVNGTGERRVRQGGNVAVLGKAGVRGSGRARRWLKRGAVKPNLVVAQDGTGDVKTLKEAAAIINNVSPTRGWYVVRVRAGVYTDKVEIARPMVALLGDGPTRTIITGSRSNADGFATWDTCTFSSSGASFVAADIRFENTAGPHKGAGVAFRATNDQALLYRCHFVGFQDTVNAHSGRQYYRECRIEGGYDFIFGRDGAAVFDRCRLDVRKWTGVEGFLGRSIITANGRTSRGSSGGFVFINCAINARDAGAKAVLGRPWKAYARVVFVGTYMSNVIEPVGWAPWPGRNYRSKPFLAEAGSYGPGARREYAGWVHPGALGKRHASAFMPDPFIKANEWVAATPLRIPYP